MKYFRMLREHAPFESLPARGARVEMRVSFWLASMPESLPARGARVEIVGTKQLGRPVEVAPRKGSEG